MVSSVGLQAPPAGQGLKRAFDIAVALPMLVLISPVMLVAMLAVRLTSPGPAIRSPRRG